MDADVLKGCLLARHITGNSILSVFECVCVRASIHVQGAL